MLPALPPPYPPPNVLWLIKVADILQLGRREVGGAKIPGFGVSGSPYYERVRRGGSRKSPWVDGDVVLQADEAETAKTNHRAGNTLGSKARKQTKQLTGLVFAQPQCFKAYYNSKGLLSPIWVIAG